MDARAHRFEFVVARLHGDGGAAAGLIEVTVGPRVHHEAAVGGDHAAAAHDLALARIGDAGFDAIAVVRLVVGNRGGKLDGEFAFGIQLAFAIHNLLVAVIVAIGVAGIGRRVLIGVVPQRKPVAAAIDGVLQPGPSHGLAEVITRIDHRLRSLALQDARFGWA